MSSCSCRRFSSSEEFDEAVAALLSQTASQTYDFPAAIMLSGGETPYGAYRRFAASKTIVSSDMHFMLSDERLVPEEDPLSNYGGMRAMFKTLEIGKEQIFTVDTAKSSTEAAMRYDQQLEAFFRKGGRVVLGLLGLGTDGHTASLFSQADLKRAERRLAVEVYKDSGPDRVSVTPLFLSFVEQLIFLVKGEAKRPILDRFLTGDDIPIARLATALSPSVDVWIC